MGSTLPNYNRMVNPDPFGVFARAMASNADKAERKPPQLFTMGNLVDSRLYAEDNNGNFTA